jgi:hypothetical protein
MYIWYFNFSQMYIWSILAQLYLAYNADHTYVIPGGLKIWILLLSLNFVPDKSHYFPHQ